MLNTRRGLAAVLVAATALVLLAAPAFAQVAPTGDASPDAPASAIFTINNLLVTLLVGGVLPVAIGFAQRPENPGWVKVVVTAALVALANGISQAVQQDGSAIISQEWVVQYLVLLGTTILAYLGLWNPATRNRGGLNVVTGSGIVPRVGATATPTPPARAA